MGRVFENPVNQDVPVQTTVTKTVDKARITFFELDIRPNRPPEGRVHFAVGFNETDGTFVRTDGGRVGLDQTAITSILKKTIRANNSLFSDIVEDVLLEHLQSVNLIPQLKSRGIQQSPI